MEQFILDTCLFVNPACRKQFGKTPDSAIAGFLKKAKSPLYVKRVVFRAFR